MANITYQNEDGKIKVKTDQTKCIHCGRCVTVCKHEARVYEDDTPRFLDDLAAGIPISLIVAPAVRTNITDYKRLFTYLKNIGVNKIFDASLGGDICIWAHVRHIEKNDSVPLITQPCPAIVSYCEIYRHDLLDKLSPIHSPMGCTAIYMKEYEGITDRIAALSPCIAKIDEFNDTGLAEYNVTFAKLQQYLENNNVQLPEKETEYDHYESGLGSIFPMPGGLKENMEFYLGNKIHVEKAEGIDVYDKLNIYAETPKEFLPDIFDVLNCAEGCNIGTAVTYGRNIFEISSVMKKRRNAATAGGKWKNIQTLQNYDKKFELRHFMREYHAIETPHPIVTDMDIEQAFKILGKTAYEDQHVDCGACGSETCRNMAIKIALGVNIPSNCLVKSAADARLEHEKSLNTLEQFEMIWGNVESAIVIIDAETRRILDANPAAVSMFGGAKETMIGEMCHKFFGQHECPILDQAQPLDRAERQFVKSDGTIIPILKSATKMSYDGRPAVLESFTDISYMKEAEEQKRMLELGKRMELMIDANPQINILFNSNFEIIDCNPAAIRFMGFGSEKEMLAGFNARLRQSLPATLSNGRATLPISERFMAAAKDGAVRFATELILDGETKSINVEFKKIPYEDSFAIVGFVSDMTDIHKRERELESARELNELQLTKLNLAVKGTKIALWDIEVVKNDPVNPENIFIWSNEFRQMLGFTDEADFPNTLSSWSNRLHPEDKYRALACLEKHLNDRTGNTPYDLEYRLLLKNGEYAYFRASGETIRDADGHAIRVAGTLMDITKTKNILLDTEKHKIEAEAASIAKSAFLSAMSHEIRTPMNAILGITEIQLQNNKLDKSVKEAFEKIFVSGDMLLEIINHILDLSKIESGKLELMLSNYEITSLISDIAQLNMMRIGSKPIEFVLYVDENLPQILSGDELRIKQIFNNLLSNAFKYTGAGTVSLSISAEPGGNDDSVALIISISDTGQGMTKEQVDSLFDQYSRFNLEANRSTEGTGLGMSITKNLVSAMGGEIFVESEPGKGSTFTVRLPQGMVGPARLGRELAENLRQFRTSSKTQMKRAQIARESMPYGRVLIVDDVETNIYVAKGLLAPYDLKIDSADSGFAAIEKIKNGNVYDIVFMDHMMPKMDGIEATKIIRSMGYKRPVVALTANAVTGQTEMFLGNGFDDFISKPIDVRQMNDVLNKLIRDKHPPTAALRQEKAGTGQFPQLAITPRIAEIFARDAAKSIAALDAIHKKHGSYTDEDLRTYVIHVHGMKSALANIGKMELSALALKLEILGRNGDTGDLASQTSVFLDSLRELVDELTSKYEAKGGNQTYENPAYLQEKLLAIKKACEVYDEKTTDEILTKLQEKTWPQPTRELLNIIVKRLLHSDFDEIADAVDKFLAA